MDEDLGCDCFECHDERIAEARDSIPDDPTVDDLSDFFKLFGDGTRVRILFALDRGEMCVCDISTALDMSMSAVSHQLRLLKDAHLVNARRDGRQIFYSLCDDHVKTIIETALEHVTELVG